MAELRAACLDLPNADDAAAEEVRRREALLTKPPGSLGRLEDVVGRGGLRRVLIAWQSWYSREITE